MQGHPAEHPDLIMLSEERVDEGTAWGVYRYEIKAIRLSWLGYASFDEASAAFSAAQAIPTWLAIDAESKLIISFLVGNRRCVLFHKLGIILFNALHISICLRANAVHSPSIQLDGLFSFRLCPELPRTSEEAIRFPAERLP